MIDILLIIVLAIVTWCVASEGAWHAAVMFFNVVFSGLLAMNFFEPLANFLQNTISSSSSWIYRWDFIALTFLFGLFVFLFRLATEKLAPTFMNVHALAYEFGRWGFGLATGYVTMAILLTALHTAPLPREFIGFTPERANLFGFMAPDRQWLGFTQFVSAKVFSKGHAFDGRTDRSWGIPSRNRVGDPTDDKPVMMPSFPMRYASRRERWASGQSASESDGTQIERSRTSQPDSRTGSPGF